MDELVGFTAGFGIGAEGLPSLGALGLVQLDEAPALPFWLQKPAPSAADVMHRWQRTLLTPEPGMRGKEPLQL